LQGSAAIIKLCVFSANTELGTCIKEKEFGFFIIKQDSFQTALRLNKVAQLCKFALRNENIKQLYNKKKIGDKKKSGGGAEY